MEINYFVEEWEDQHDFHFLSDYSEINHKNFNVFTTNHHSDFNVFMASPAVKAKFKYPARDPIPNEIQDNRSDSEKVSDIFLIWTQILKPEKQSICNKIAERDITKQISLQSGMRIPKSIIKKDISDHLKTLIKVRRQNCFRI